MNTLGGTVWSVGYGHGSAHGEMVDRQSSDLESRTPEIDCGVGWWLRVSDVGEWHRQPYGWGVGNLR